MIAYVEHVVQPGDTVFLIALQYGSTVPRIIRENRIRDVRKLYVGTALRVPIVTDADPERASVIRARNAGRPAPAPAPVLAPVERLMTRTDEELRSAQFEDALDTSEDALARLDGLPDAVANPLRARLHVARATAQVAMSDTDAARQSLEQALRADPELEFDPERTSPKLLSVYYQAEQSVGR